MKYIICLYAVVLPSLLLASINNPIKTHDQLEKQKEIFEKLEKNQNNTILYNNVKKPEELPPKNEKCFNIKKITENTLTLLNTNEKETLFGKYVGTCSTLTDLKNLTNKLTSNYIDKGYITSKVYLLPQNISLGEVKLHAIEGKVSSIFPSKSYINNVFLEQKGDFLNLRDLETSIELINRLPSNHATMKLLPSSKTGYTDIHIENNTTSRINGSIGINNFGTKKTGKVQGSFSLSLDDMLGISDQLSINLNSTDKHFSDENSVGDSYYYSFPIGHFLNTISYRKTSYEQLIPAGITNYESNGHTKTYEYNLKYKLFDNQNNSLTVGSGIVHTKSENFIENSLIETSTYNLSNVNFSIDYLYRTTGFYALVSFGFEQGTDWFNTLNPTVLNEKYSLYTVDLSLQKNFQILNYTLSGHFQQTNDKLFNKAQISIGGPYSVRGFQDEGLNGNSGYYVRNELSKTLKSKFLGQLVQSYFVAIDGGHIKEEEDTNGGNLLSASVGLKLSKGNFSANMTYSMPIYKEDVETIQKFLGFNLTYQF